MDDRELKVRCLELAVKRVEIGIALGSVKNDVLELAESLYQWVRDDKVKERHKFDARKRSSTAGIQVW